MSIQVTMGEEEFARRWAHSNNFALVDYAVLEKLAKAHRTSSDAGSVVYNPDKLTYEMKTGK